MRSGTTQNFQAYKLIPTNRLLGWQTVGFLDGIQLLNRLGLTLRQAKVYLSLAQGGASSVKEISKLSSVPREDIYRILQALQKMGLVEKRIAFPVTFEAIPVHEALSFLHERRINETSYLQVEGKKFLKATMENLAGKNPREDESQFVLIPEKEAVLARRKKAISNTEHTVDVVNSWKRHLSSAQVYAEEIDKPLKRGVRIRVVTQKPKEAKTPRFLADLQSKPGFEVRYVLTYPSALISIYDGKGVFILVDESAGLGKSPALWSNNRSLVALAQSYFDLLWLASAEKTKRKTEPNVQTTC